MPSSNKTGHLGLNSWLGSDKPKKDDFNSDNRLVDAACREMDGRVTAAMESAQAAGAHIADNALHVSGADRTAWGAHLADTVAHVTAQERAGWGAGGGIVVGTYTGDGDSTRKIPLERGVKFGLLFAMGFGIADADLANLESRMYAGFFSPQGCSKNIVLMSDGFTVLHTVTKPIDGLGYKYNQNGVTYVYVIWPQD